MDHILLFELMDSKALATDRQISSFQKHCAVSMYQRSCKKSRLIKYYFL